MLRNKFLVFSRFLFLRKCSIILARGIGLEPFRTFFINVSRREDISLRRYLPYSLYVNLRRFFACHQRSAVAALPMRHGLEIPDRGGKNTMKFELLDSVNKYTELRSVRYVKSD